ncbi:2,3-butanediol dehydrogenase [Rhodococcus fascians]|nr:2,3-butanediol dehydrogenase [Rhodococcus fascians]MBY3999461.1 2,3-butanediol dehydrogenase [Rhodococcus fascians]MBY4004994.1 2,3-butanediol dehydrogenase [Rhodococcus fascians]MBY4010133.1 2,3-butanediol dehydrogenase [Rhodococcus fascians]MBY4020201.1 2,3-butanediol dehydrogenase [Rhodococcus fascians]
MLAAMYYGKERLEVVDVEERHPGPTEVKVRVGFNGICGSDLHEFYGGPVFVPVEAHPLTGHQLPLILGHEFSGTIVEMGSAVDGYKIGGRVTVEPIYRCGLCAPCVAGNYNVCRQIGFHGIMADGGMAEFSIVPVGMLHKLPDNVPLELGALVEPMAVAYHAARFGEVGVGDTAMILGAGPIGIGLWFALKGLGLEDITIVEPAHDRRKASAALGAHVLDPSAQDVVGTVLDATAGRGISAVFDASGARAAVETGIACLASRSPLVSVAMYETPIETPLVQLILNETRIQGSLGYTSEDFRAVLRLMEEEHYDPTGWVSTIPISAVVEEGFEALRAGTKMKVLVDPAS